MKSLKRLFTSSLGKKYLMALTGLGLFGFVIGHMVGNLQIFLGPDALNTYAHFLQSKAGLLWGARLSLLAMVAVHVWTAIQLSAENLEARPRGYDGDPEPKAASYASRTMIWSGGIVAAFIIYHILHFTLGVTHPDHFKLVDDQGRHDVFAMVVMGFSNPLVAGWYLFAMALLCIHLSHGVGSLFQSLGLRSGQYKTWIDRGAIALAWIIFLGNASMPVAILLGYGHP